MSISVLIAAKDSMFIKSLMRTFGKTPAETVRCGNTREEILDALNERHYDCVFIHFVSGDTLLSELIGEIHEKFKEIQIVSTILADHRSLLKKLILSSRVTLVQIPLSCERLAHLIFRVTEKDRHELYPHIADFAFLMGLRYKYDGFSYLCSAVALIIDDPMRKNAVVKKVYSVVAEKHGASTLMVDRSLRYLAKVAFEDGIVPKLTRGQLNTRLTNYELICALGDLFYTKSYRSWNYNCMESDSPKMCERFAEIIK